MNILIVDDEVLAAQSLEATLRKILGNAPSYSLAKNGEQALSLAEITPPDLAFLDIEMPGMNGMALAKHLKDCFPEADLVFVTAYPQYSLEAWKVHASDYLLKPANEQDVRNALENLRHPTTFDPTEMPGQLRVQCFGTFAVFYDGEPVHFSRSAAKELFAYLVSRRGASATTGELCSILWEDDRDLNLKKSYLRTYFSSLRKTFALLGVEDAVIHSRDSYAVNPQKLICDYYHFLEMDPVAVNSYRGEFMSQYSWAEMMVFPLNEALGGTNS